jgi:hypothetical protein
VIVDEGQDFGKHEWAIEKYAVKFDLGRPYRCTPGIQVLADAYVGGRTGEGGGRARGLKEKAGREGVWRAEGGRAEAGAGEGSGIDEYFRPAESVYLVMLCGLPWRAVIIIKSDDYCA